MTFRPPTAFLRGAPLVLVLTLTLLEIASGGARAAPTVTYALMGAHGEAFPQVLQEVDKSARRALTDNGLRVVAAGAMNAQIEDLAKANALEGCVVTDDDCAVRIGLALGVDVVVTTSVRVVGSRMLLVVAALSTSSTASGPAHRVFGELTLPARDEGQSVRATVLRALKVPSTALPAPVPVTVVIEPETARASTLLLVKGQALPVEDGRAWIPPGAYDVIARAPQLAPIEQHLVVPDDALVTATFRFAPEEPPPAPLARASSSSPPSPPPPSSSSSPPGDDAFLSVPLLVALSGAGLAVAGGVVAGVSEALLYTAQSRDDRGATRAAGVTGLVVGGVGAATALGAGALVMLE